LARVQSGRTVGRRSGAAAGAPKGAPQPPRLVGLRPDPIAKLEQKSREIRDPVEKLRYLRRSLERYEDVDQKLQAVPVAPLRWLAYRVTGVESARPLFTGNPNGALANPHRRGRELPRRVRRALNAAALLVVAAAGLALAAYPRGRGSLPAEGVPSGTAPVQSSLPVAEALPAVPRVVAPEGIWMVQSGKAFELYSNGLRIDTSYAVAGEPRRYLVFDSEGGGVSEAQDRPIGILFHTSESDIWPLEESFNGKLRDSSQNLLHYLRKNKVYHYLIDRFGQVFRVVEEQTKANHAGMSVWSVGRHVYLNLNGPTIGVSFETRWEGGRALPITRAQLEAGRSLTDYLRQKWSIEPELCVTHGLTSVNPRRRLIGHHVDWARGFPFAAFGLPDQYARPSPAIALFGFGHDEGLVARMGEPWPGVAAADRLLQSEADEGGTTLPQLRREKAARYDRWLDQQARDAGNSSAEAVEPRRDASGG
jgi:hypothetical protein